MAAGVRSTIGGVFKCANSTVSRVMAISLLEATKTGQRYCSARLKACTVSV
jgi:hypothetical protein